MACYVEADSGWRDYHQLWVEQDTHDDTITFDCPECDYWRIVSGQPSREQLHAMQIVAVNQLRRLKCE